MIDIVDHFRSFWSWINYPFDYVTTSIVIFVWLYMKSLNYLLGVQSIQKVGGDTRGRRTITRTKPYSWPTLFSQLCPGKLWVSCLFKNSNIMFFLRWVFSKLKRRRVFFCSFRSAHGQTAGHPAWFCTPLEP